MRQYTDKFLKNDRWILDAIQGESARQKEKWGIQAHSAFEWLTYTAEELGELAKAICDHEYRGDAGRWSRRAVVTEAVQLATLALKIAEMFEEAADAIKD